MRVVWRYSRRFYGSQDHQVRTAHKTVLGCYSVRLQTSKFRKRMGFVAIKKFCIALNSNSVRYSSLAVTTKSKIKF